MQILHNPKKVEASPYVLWCKTKTMKDKKIKSLATFLQTGKLSNQKQQIFALVEISAETQNHGEMFLTKKVLDERWDIMARGKSNH